MTRRVAIIAAVVTFAVAFGAIAPPEHCPDPSPARVRGAAQAAVSWFVRNQRADGSWLYEYDATRRRESPDYNVVRHAGAINGLYQAAAAHIPGALESGDRGLTWALERVVPRGTGSALDTDGTLPTGASALLVAALVHRRALTHDTGHDDVLRRLGRFLVDTVQPNGAVAAFGAPSPGAEPYSKYYTGETFWALALLARTFPDEDWRAPAERIQHYLATERDDAEGYWPPVPDHWAAYGMAELATAPGAAKPDDAVVRYARRQAELFGVQVRTVSQRFGPWGRWARGTWVPRGGGYGVVGEALGQLWRLSGVTPGLESVRGAVAARDRCIVGLAIDAQTPASSADGRARGAWLRDGVTRMDDQQHALSALLATVPAGHTAPSPPPTRWLWVAALVALADPFRVALAGRRRPSPTVLAALAAGAVAVAWLSGPVLDAMQVSTPSARLAAASVLAAAAVAHLVRVRLHVALVAAPVVLLAAGADVGVGVVAPAAVVAATAASALPAFPALRWVARGVAAALLAAAIVLGVASLLSV